jgi:hypothetical protein
VPIVSRPHIGDGNKILLKNRPPHACNPAPTPAAADLLSHPHAPRRFRVLTNLKIGVGCNMR